MISNFEYLLIMHETVKYIVAKGSKALILLGCLCYFSCNNSDPKPKAAPVLQLNQITKIDNGQGSDSLLLVDLTYEDEDGDLGLDEEMTDPPFNFGNAFFYNLFVEMYTNTDTGWSQITNPDNGRIIDLNERFANLTPGGNDKHIKGEMELSLFASPYPGVKPEKVFFKFQIADRNLHLSNQVVSDTLILKFQ